MTLKRPLIGPAVLALAAALPLAAAHALPLPPAFDFTETGGPRFGVDGGAGLIFDPGSGLGGWIGQLAALPSDARSVFDTLVSFSTQGLPDPAGTVSFAGDFAFVLRDIDGLTPDDDVLFGSTAGTLALDPAAASQRLVSVAYTVTSGTGLFSGFTGSGASSFGFDTEEPGNLGAFSYSGGGRFGLVAQPVPEPGTLALLLLGGLGLAWQRHRPARGVLDAMVA